MTARSPTLERPIEGKGPPSTEVLFKEARQRRRRRWTLALMALVLVGAGAGVGYGVTGHGGRAGAPTSTSASHDGTPPPSSNPSIASSYTSAYTLGRADAESIWMANGYGVYLTTDSGRTWQTITPPDLGKGQPPGDQVGAVVAVGTTYLWLAVTTVTGLVPITRSVGGSTRAVGIERSTDGGATWTFAPLPGCLQACGGTIAVSFVDAEHGFATEQFGTSPNGAGRLFATDDGGASWRTVADVPFGAVGAIRFTTLTDGWATSAGGRLYSTADGGVAWTTPRGLPGGDRYQLPKFFGSDGVVMGAPASGSRRRPVAFVTHDGGATWTPRPFPEAVVVGYSRSIPPTLPFAAVSMDDWVVDTGPSVYATTDGGRHWSRTLASNGVAVGSVARVAFSSLTDGVAMGMPPGCPADGEAIGRPDCYEVLTGTHDGGSHWVALHP